MKAIRDRIAHSVLTDNARVGALKFTCQVKNVKMKTYNEWLIICG